MTRRSRLQRQMQRDMQALKAQHERATMTPAERLHNAACRNNVPQIRAIIAEGAHPDTAWRGTPPLLTAIYNSSIAAAKALLEAGADPDATGSEGETVRQVISDHHPLRPLIERLQSRQRLL